jgi:hypothetical protein
MQRGSFALDGYADSRAELLEKRIYFVVDGADNADVATKSIDSEYRNPSSNRLPASLPDDFIYPVKDGCVFNGFYTANKDATGTGTKIYDKDGTKVSGSIIYYGLTLYPSFTEGSYTFRLFGLKNVNEDGELMMKSQQIENEFGTIESGVGVPVAKDYKFIGYYADINNNNNTHPYYTKDGSLVDDFFGNNGDPTEVNARKAPTEDINLYAHWKTFLQSGTVGGVDWAYDEDTKVLTLTPSSANVEHTTGNLGTTDETNPLEHLCDDVQKIVIEEGVSGIGENAFFNFTYVRSIVCESTVLGNNVAKSAFKNVGIRSSSTNKICQTTVSNGISDAIYYVNKDIFKFYLLYIVC